MKKIQLLLPLIAISAFVVTGCNINNSSASSNENETASSSSSSNSSNETSTSSNSKSSISSIERNTSSSSQSSSSSFSSSSISSSSQEAEKPVYEIKEHTLFAYKEGKARFEAEEVDATNYVISSDNPSKVVERNDASNGKFLAASTGDTTKNSIFTFSISLDFNAEVNMTASYVQTNKWKDNDEDLTKAYSFIIDENRNMMISSNKTTLKARSDITKWETFNYDTITLAKGKHLFSVKVAENTGKGNPNIDYFDFTFTKVDNVKEDITVPNNDIHSNLQYSYINDSNIENIEKYAKGVSELSIPKGIVIDLSEVESSNYSLLYADNNKFENSTLINNIKEKKCYTKSYAWTKSLL